MRMMKLGPYTLPVGEKTYLMGIVNVTPDSFSDGGQFYNPEQAVKHAVSLEAEGADILDIGGESTRPGHEPVSEAEELMRVLPVIENLPKNLSSPVSVDTTKPAVARKALSEGTAIINNVAHTDESLELMMTAAEFGAGYVIMHSEKEFPSETNTLYRISRYFEYSIQCALNCGLKEENLILDPGIGFYKTQEQNLEIVAGLSAFAGFGLPVLMGLSRKSFIGAVTGQPPERRDVPTIAANAIAIAGGADILRVHNVAAHQSAVRICDKILRLNVSRET